MLVSARSSFAPPAAGGFGATGRGAAQTGRGAAAPVVIGGGRVPAAGVGTVLVARRRRT
ncbi:hypothetical protein [Streptomyces sp. NPDC002104]